MVSTGLQFQQLVCINVLQYLFLTLFEEAVFTFLLYILDVSGDVSSKAYLTLRLHHKGNMAISTYN